MVWVLTLFIEAVLTAYCTVSYVEGGNGWNLGGAIFVGILAVFTLVKAVVETSIKKDS